LSDATPAPWTVSVRELVEFTAKRGDLDLRFTPAPTAEEGIAGHARVAQRRGPGWVREVVLTAREGDLLLRGRADGWDPALNRLEEIKTYRGRLERIPEHHRALAWAQLKLYGAMRCREQGLEKIRLRLTYLDIGREKETSFDAEHDASELDAFLVEHAARYLDWARQEQAHRRRRDAGMAALPFPFPNFHAGQRRLAEAAYRVARDGGCLMAQAPTGIGKTIGTLFPLLKACARGQIDRVFFLTAKTPGRQLAIDGVARLRADSTPEERPLRLLELVAREKACVNPDKACHGESCPLARGFYDRLPAARAEAVAAAEPLTQAVVARVAAAHAVCPYFLSQELARWSDVVVGDYHYWFDGSALLHALTAANDWNVALLVDEAHNLLERGRAMYSATLDSLRLAAARAVAPAPLKRHLQALQREWNRLVDDARDESDADYAVLQAPPASLIDALGKLVSAITDQAAEAPERLQPALQDLLFDAVQFRALAESFGPHSILDLSRHGRARGSASRRPSTLCLRNVVPAPFLGPRLAAAGTAVLFSATLAPTDFYRDMLGVPDGTVALDVPSPFDSAQLRVTQVRDLSTRFNDRAASIEPVADLIAGGFREHPGNYLAFFSSFDYLHEVAAMLARRHPDVPQWSQTRGMNEADRTAFLSRFAEGGQGVGFAVLGGAFGEGIDLPGTRLIGAFVATLGQPQVNPVNEQMRRLLEAQFAGRGYDYTYFYPGLQKVVQAAGRVIRGEQDRGSLVLIDDRFGWRTVRDLLPPWWRIRGIRARPQGAMDFSESSAPA
jgi:DNA excision repair protein ERCC-2